MSVRRHGATAGLSLLAACTLTVMSGCAGQSPDTAGTPLLTLHGKVLASVLPLSSALVPALTFTPFITNAGHSEFIVGGEHEGDMRGDFTLQVYAQPPAEALSLLTQGEPALAVGGITAVSPDHPARLDWVRGSDGSMQVCSEDECGVPSDGVCVPGAAPGCYGTLVSGKNWGNHGVASSYSVLYLAQAVAAGSTYSQFFAQGVKLAAGYHLIRSSNVWAALDSAARQANLACQTRATAAALAQFNLDHGTDYLDHELITEAGREAEVQLLADWDGAMLTATVNEGCVLPGSQTLVTDTASSDPISLILAQ